MTISELNDHLLQSIGIENPVDIKQIIACKDACEQITYEAEGDFSESHEPKTEDYFQEVSGDNKENYGYIVNQGEMMVESGMSEKELFVPVMSENTVKQNCLIKRKPKENEIDFILRITHAIMTKKGYAKMVTFFEMKTFFFQIFVFEIKSIYENRMGLKNSEICNI